MTPVTQILHALEQGDPQAASQLLPLVYDELRRLAAHNLAHEKPGQTLDATSLVHEAYLRLVGEGADVRWDSRGHFYAAAAEAMRRILIDNARRKRSRKHGGGMARHDVESLPLAESEPDAELLALDEALTRLAQMDAAKAELVRLRYFAGLKLDECANVLGISPATADRWWAYARAWLHLEITRDRNGGKKMPIS
jgi:RNA polymerase sigma factor (TIGR02999 family)